MAGLRKGTCYTKIKRAYTRMSKFKKKSYIKVKPTSKIIRYLMGDKDKKFTHKISLVNKAPLQIRHNAIEASRQVVNRHLHLKLGSDYLFQIKLYPHHVLRENKMITGAGADRMQTGMQKAFGKSIGIAAQIRKSREIFTISVDKENLDVAKKALKLACPRLPGGYILEVKGE